jgi:hypothetical protein
MTVTAERRGAMAVRTADVPWYDLGARRGINLKAMTFSDESGTRHVLVALGTLAPDAISPRHQHTFEQVRYFIDGDMRFGDETYDAGDCVYFPEGLSYGPQLGVPGSDSLHLTLQWGGPAGIYYPSKTEQHAAREALSARGTFKDGMYTRADGSSVDGFEAIVEQITGKACVYPAPRYERPIRMRTHAFAWQPLGDAAGVAIRRLACFNEVGPEISMLRLAGNARLPATIAAGDEVRLLISGEVRYGEAALDGVSCMYVPDGGNIDAIHATADSELLAVRFNIPT